jgi:hypothetical protein
MKTFKAYLEEDMVAKTVDQVLNEGIKQVNLSMDEIKSRLTAAGYNNFKDKSSSQVFVLVDNVNRVELLQKIEKIFSSEGAKYDPEKGQSSVGMVVVGRFSIGASPASKQGKKSAGLDNEDTLINNINSFVKNGPINIKFIAGKKTFKVDGVIKAIEMGRDTSGRKKSDVNLQTKSGKIIPISLKKDGAEMWESADSYYAKKAKDIIDRLIIDKKVTLSGRNIKKITPNIAIEATKKEAKDVVFGSDLLGTGAVLYRTWKASDFKITENGNLEIISSKIYTNEREVENGDHSVYFLIRNDSSRKGSKIYPGIRVLAVGKTRINKNVLVVKS